MTDVNILLGELNRIGIHLVISNDYSYPAAQIAPEELLGGLASQNDARLRFALIAVLLQIPEYTQYTSKVLDILDEYHCIIFKLYYTASHCLQLLYMNQLHRVLGDFQFLPDKYSQELQIPQAGTIKDQLHQLAKRHQEISGLSLNWYGTYNHAAQRVIARLEVEEVWMATPSSKSILSIHPG